MLTAVANILGAVDRLEKSNETRVTSREIKRMLRPMRLCTQLPWVHEPFLKTQPGLPPAGAARALPATPSHPRPVPVGLEARRGTTHRNERDAQVIPLQPVEGGERAPGEEPAGLGSQ